MVPCSGFCAGQSGAHVGVHNVEISELEVCFRVLVTILATVSMISLLMSLDWIPGLQLYGYVQPFGFGYSLPRSKS